MSDSAAAAGATVAPGGILRGGLGALFIRSEPLRGYTLLSPTLLVMAFGICIPFAIMVTMSFWSQHAFDFDTTFSLANYGEAVERPLYAALL